MSCEHIGHLMQRELDNDLTQKERDELQHHLSSCRGCYEEYEQLQALDEQLSALPKVHPPQDIVEHMFAKGMFSKKRYWFSALTVAAAVLLFVLLANPSLWSPLSDMEQMMEEEAAEHAADGIGDEEVSADDEALDHALYSTEESAPENMLPEPNIEREETEGASVGRGVEEDILLEEAAEEGVEEGKGSHAGEAEPGDPSTFVDKEGIEYPSPDGKYTAYLGLDAEDIRIDQEGEPYFLSMNPRSPLWSVEWLEWVSTHELYYVLQHEEESSEEYWLIDVLERVEEEREAPHPASSRNLAEDKG